MYESLKSALITWNNKTNERQKLQHIYIAVTVFGILIAGVITLVNPNLGHTVVLIAFFALVAFLSNAVVWNLLKAGLISNLPRNSKRK